MAILLQSCLVLLSCISMAIRNASGSAVVSKVYGMDAVNAYENTLYHLKESEGLEGLFFGPF